MIDFISAYCAHVVTIILCFVELFRLGYWLGERKARNEWFAERLKAMQDASREMDDGK